MTEFIEQALSSLPNGGIYASLALALVVIYQSTRHINFAQGEMAMFSAYVAWFFMQLGLGYWSAFGITLGISAGMGMLIQRFLLQPLLNAPPLSLIVVSIGLLMIFHGAAGLFFDHGIRQFPSPFDNYRWLQGLAISPHAIGTVALCAVIMCILFSFFRFSRAGLAIRAASLNRDSANLVGVNVTFMLMLGWGLAAVLGAVAGVMTAPVVYLSPDMMSGVLLYALAAALLGGITSPLGAVVSGFLVSLIETLASVYIVGTEYKLTVALVIIVAVLVLRPSGLFGKPITKRV